MATVKAIFIPAWVLKIHPYRCYGRDNNKSRNSDSYGFKKNTQRNTSKSILKIAVSEFGGRKVGKDETSYKNSVSAMTYFVVKWTLFYKKKIIKKLQMLFLDASC